MKNILTLTLTLTLFSLAAIAQTTTQQVDRMKVKSILELPAYNSLANATLAGAKPGNLIRVHSGAEKGLYFYQDDAWVKLNFDTAFLYSKINNKLDSLKVIAGTLWWYSNGDSTNAGTAGGGGGASIDSVRNSSDGNGIVVKVNGVSSPAQKVALGALNEDGANRHDGMRFDGATWRPSVNSSLPVNTSLSGVSADTTIAKKDFSAVLNTSDLSLYKIQSTPVYANDSLEYFSKKILVKGAIKNYVPNNTGAARLNSAGSSPTAVISPMSSGDTNYVSYRKISYSHYMYANVIKILADTQYNHLTVNDTMLKAPNAPDSLEISFYIKSLNGKSYTYTSNFYWAANATTTGNFADVRANPVISISPVWTEVKFKVPASGFNKRATATPNNDLMFYVSLPTHLTYNDSVGIYGVKFSQMKTLFAEEGFSTDTLLATTNLPLSAIASMNITLPEYTGIVVAPGMNFRTSSGAAGFLYIPNSIPDPFGGMTAGEIFLYMSTNAVRFNDLNPVPVTFDKKNYRYSYWYKWLPVGQGADTNFSLKADIAFNGSGLVTLHNRIPTYAGSLPYLTYKDTWQRFDTTIFGSVLVNDPTTSSFTHTFNLGQGGFPPNRSISVWGLQMEDSTATLKDTRITGDAPSPADSSYANFIQNGILDLSKVVKATSNDRKFVQYALNLCASVPNAGCRIVQLGSKTYNFIDTTLCIPSGITLMGLPGTKINLNFSKELDGIRMLSDWSANVSDTIVYLPFIGGSGSLPVSGSKVTATINGVTVSGTVIRTLNTTYGAVTSGSFPSQGLLELRNSGDVQAGKVARFKHNPYPSVFRRGKAIVVKSADGMTTYATATTRGEEDFKRARGLGTVLKGIEINCVANVDYAVTTGAFFNVNTELSDVYVLGNNACNVSFDIANPTHTWTSDVSIDFKLNDLTAGKGTKIGFYIRKVNTSQMNNITATAWVGIKLQSSISMTNIWLEGCDTGLYIYRGVRAAEPTKEQPCVVEVDTWYSESTGVDLYITNRSVIEIANMIRSGRLIAKDSSKVILRNAKGAYPNVEIDTSSVIRGYNSNLTAGAPSKGNLYMEVLEKSSVKSNMPYTSYYQGMSANTPIFNKPLLSDTIALSNVTLNGAAINYNPHSDSIRYNVAAHNVALTPWGTMTADSVRLFRKPDGSGYNLHTFNHAISAGQEVTMSFYVKIVSTCITPVQFIVRGILNPAWGTSNVSMYIDPCYGQWVRYEIYGITYADVPSFGLEVVPKLSDVATIFYIAGIQVNPGRSATELVHTSGTPIVNTDVTINTAGNKPLKLPNSNLNLGTDKYISFGGTDGSTGYGFRDSSGFVQVKNASGVWGGINPVVSVSVSAVLDSDFSSFEADTWANILTVSVPHAGKWHITAQALVYGYNSTAYDQKAALRVWDGTTTATIGYVNYTVPIDGSNWATITLTGEYIATEATTLTMQARVSNITNAAVLSQLYSDAAKATQLHIRSVN